MSPQLLWAVLILPLAGALVNGFLLSNLPHAAQRRVSGLIATLVSALAFVVTVLVAMNLGSILGTAKFVDVIAGSWIQAGDLDVPFGLRIDALSITMGLVVTGVGTLIHLFSIGYMADDRRVTRYFTYLNLFMFSMLVLVLANNYLLMFVGWEGVGLCSYLLIGFWFERVSAAQAGKKAFIINRVGDFGFLLAMFALFWLTGSLTFNNANHTGALDQVQRILTAPPILGGATVVVICLLFFLAATGKSAQLPLYLWLPDAMEGPTPVSALIHAATMVTAGVYLVARSAPLFNEAPGVQSLVAWIGVITALIAALAALKQYDIKRVLAYSTVSQLGYMFVGVGVGAYSAGLFHVVTHAFFKGLMFLGAGAVMHALEGQLDMRKMGGLSKHMKVTFYTFAIGWLAISGFPLLSGYFSKDMILEHAYEKNQAIFWIGALVAFLTAFYMTRLFVTVFRGNERIEMGDEGHHGAEEDSHAAVGHAAPTHGHAHGAVHVHPEQMVMNLPLMVLGFLSLVGGFALVNVLPGLIDPLTTVTAHGAEGGHGGGHAAWGINSAFTAPALISTLMALAGLGAGLAYGPARFAQGWSPSLERLFSLPIDVYEGTMHLIFVRGGDAVANLLYRVVDRGIIDRAVDGMGDFVNFLADNLRTLQTGYVRNYALVMLAGAVFVVACFLVILQNTPK
jgi:NADH-quinone oxidoreductase subunit L